MTEELLQDRLTTEEEEALEDTARRKALHFLSGKEDGAFSDEIAKNIDFDVRGIAGKLRKLLEIDLLEVTKRSVNQNGNLGPKKNFYWSTERGKQVDAILNPSPEGANDPSNNPPENYNNSVPKSIHLCSVRGANIRILRALSQHEGNKMYEASLRTKSGYDKGLPMRTMRTLIDEGIVKKEDGNISLITDQQLLMNFFFAHKDADQSNIVRKFQKWKKGLEPVS